MEQYSKNRTKRDGLSSVCKDCARERSAAWYRDHREYAIARQAAKEAEIPGYRERKYDLAKAPHRREKARVAEKAYAERDPERFREKGNVQNHVNRAKRAGAPVIERVSHAEVLRRGNWTCGLCQLPIVRGEESVDHIKSLATGGTNTYDNMQPAHRRCNSAKRDR